MPRPRYWMISDRNVQKDGFGSDKADLTYWFSGKAPLDNYKNWTQVTQADFQNELVAAAGRFSMVEPGEHLKQSHVTFFVHGYNNGWDDAARRYEKLCDDLFEGPNGLGICVSFDWPSLGSVLGYLPDRDHARRCASDLADVLSALYDWLLGKQQAAAIDPKDACRAKVSMIAHSMGNYLLQRAMASAWTRKNQPLLVSLLNQLLMVAADVDNDLFEDSADDGGDGKAIANLTYRVTALTSGRDEVLGASAGMKHFGTRRLGRSGLAVRPPTGKDNVWDIDCSSFFAPSVGGNDIHSAYFKTQGTIDLMRELLRGLDRGVLEATGMTKGTAWPPSSKPMKAFVGGKK